MTTTRTHSLYELSTRARAALAAGKTFQFHAPGREYVEISYVAGGSFVNVCLRSEPIDPTVHPGRSTLQTTTLPSAELGFQIDRFTEWSATLLANAAKRTHTLDDVLRSGVVHGIAEAAKTLKARIPAPAADATDAEIAELRLAAQAWRGVVELLNEETES